MPFTSLRMRLLVSLSRAGGVPPSPPSWRLPTRWRAGWWPIHRNVRLPSRPPFLRDEAGVSLPDFVVPAVFLQVADEDGVAFPDDVQAFFGDHAGQRTARPGRGRVAPQNIMRDAHGGAQFPHLVLEQFRQRFQYFPLRLELQHAFHAIVVGLDDGGLGFGVGGAFDHVRVQGALGEHFRVSHGIPENVDEQASDDAALLFRIAFSVQAARKRSEASTVSISTFMRAKLARTSSASFLRSRPLSTKMARMFTPASCSRTASTVLSTPPETPQTTACRPRVPEFPG